LIPIYIAGVNTGLARLAGEVCDGFHAHPFHSPRYLTEIIVPAIERGAQRAGRSRREVAISVTAFTASSPEEMNAARAHIAFYASTPSYRPVMALHGWGEAAERLSAHASRGEWSEMPAIITEEMLHQFCTVANEDDLGAALKKRYGGIADRLTMYSQFVPGEKDAWWQNIAKSMKHR
jgi:probable F420-dependent oxidoreductase